jgi:subtilisin family serine protease
MTRALGALAAVCAMLPAGATAAQVIGPAVRARAQADGAAAVVVALRAPAAPGEARLRSARRAAIARLREAVLARLAAGDVEVEHAYRTVPGFAGRVSAAGLERLAASPDVLRIDLDPVGGAAAEAGTAAGDSVAQIRADRVQARGITGIGSTIAVIDTGVQADHPDIADALAHEECFCSGGRLGDQQRPPCCPDGTARASGPGSAASRNAHGPHVTGIALSRGRVAPVGVAPGAQLIAIRVLDDGAEGFLSDWIAALDWLADERPDARVINMSLVSDAAYAGDCGHDCGDAPGCAANALLADAIEQLWDAGAVVFAAAGNDGRLAAMTAPACIARAVAVGAVDAGDAVAGFSNTSPELDLLAPGVNILSDGVEGGLAVMSGTSMATPHAAGAAALLLSARPALGAVEVEAALAAGGVAVRDARTGQTTPRIDAFAALHAALRGAALERGGGSRATDCLLEWSFVPPAIMQHRGWPLAVCTDNDPLCDADHELGRCTFLLSPCFNMRDPVLRGCAVDEPLLSFEITSPPVDAPAGSIDRVNVDYLASALPDFPFGGSGACSAPIPFVVERPRADAAGIAHIRMAVATATRRDYDHLVLECLPP